MNLRAQLIDGQITSTIFMQINMIVFIIGHSALLIWGTEKLAELVKSNKGKSKDEDKNHDPKA